MPETEPTNQYENQPEAPNEANFSVEKVLETLNERKGGVAKAINELIEIKKAMPADSDTEDIDQTMKDLWGTLVDMEEVKLELEAMKPRTATTDDLEEAVENADQERVSFVENEEGEADFGINAAIENDIPERNIKAGQYILVLCERDGEAGADLYDQKKKKSGPSGFAAWWEMIKAGIRI